MDKFSEILNDLILETGLSVNKIAKESKISATQLGKYLKGSYPSVEIAIKIGNYFNCSLDYLFGISENKTKKFKNYDLSLFLKRYLKVLAENNISNWKFMQQHNLSESSFRRWRKGEKPSIPYLIVIAKDLSTSIDYLIGGKN